MPILRAMMRGRATLTTISGLWALTWPLLAQTTDRCTSPVGEIVSAQGSIEVTPRSQNVSNSVSLNTLLCPGDSIRVGQRSRAAILVFDTGAVIRIDQLTTLQIGDLSPPGRSILDVLIGAIHFFSRSPQSLEVRTPFVNAGVEGTEFLVRVEQNRTLLSVFEGRVRLTNDQGALLVTSNQSAEVGAGQAPQLRLVVRPRDGVQWAVYYQPVLTPTMDPSLPPTVQNLALQESLGALSRGRLTEAFDALNKIPDADRNESFYLYRAGLLLSVGRTDEARSDLDQAQAISPENADVYALLAIIAVAQNDREQALFNGREAVTRSPRSSAALIALSYAQQANFELEAARDTLLQAVEQQPNDTLAWARLAELWLSLGHVDRALEAAERATSVGPDLGRTQTVLGFARLAQIKLSEAKAAFERAISLESESSLARLGLGLAKIRDGDLGEGRSDIEIAAALDPNNALIRSYLGKAYFEEKRDRLAGEQLNLAKQLDPNDPTPYFYDAIRKQTINRPVEALQDLQKSMELNDNRAVYRSRLLLDEDLAARSASLSRIYRDLGFEQLALVQGWRSVNTDPSDYSGHRFLADSYSVLPRHEIARVSELLQSQLLQPINITPLQPQLAESNLFILQGAGPSDPSFNEFGPLFTRNRMALQANGIVGGNDVIGNDLVVSGIEGRFSFSVGQFHSETDGFRENNDSKQNIYNAFTQVRLSEKTSVQAEFRSKDFDRGDLLLRFDPDNFSSDLRQKDRVHSLRFGFHHAFAPHSDLIANVNIQRADLDTSLGITEFNVDEDGQTVEVQYLYGIPRLKLTAGAGHAQVDRTDMFSFGGSPPTVDEAQLKHNNLYLYSQLNYLDDLTLTLGASADFFRGGGVDRDQFNPKMGATWTPLPATTIRAAAFRILTKTLISDQTVEPTQVAGFNQFFDDAEGSRAWRYGFGIDQKLSAEVERPLFVGAEFSKRDLEVPGFIPFPVPTTITEDFEEKLGRAYLNWAPHAWWGLSAEYQFERFTRDLSFVGPEDFTELKTQRLMLGSGFFHPSGFKASLKATYVDQEGEFGDGFGNISPGEDAFWVVDASVSYRLPRRFGLITLVGKNIFGEEFGFQDTDPGDPRILPDRLILLKLSLFF